MKLDHPDLIHFNDIMMVQLNKSLFSLLATNHTQQLIYKKQGLVLKFFSHLLPQFFNSYSSSRYLRAKSGKRLSINLKCNLRGIVFLLNNVISSRERILCRIIPSSFLKLDVTAYASVISLTCCSSAWLWHGLLRCNG